MAVSAIMGPVALVGSVIAAGASIVALAAKMSGAAKEAEAYAEAVKKGDAAIASFTDRLIEAGRIAGPAGFPGLGLKDAQAIAAVTAEIDALQKKHAELMRDIQETPFSGDAARARGQVGPLQKRIEELRTLRFEMKAVADEDARAKKDRATAAPANVGDEALADETELMKRYIKNLNDRADIERDYQARLKATADAEAEAIADRLADEAEAARTGAEAIARLEQEFRARKAILENEAAVHNANMQIDAAEAVTRALAEEAQQRAADAVRAAEEQFKRVQAALLGTVSGPTPMRFAPPEESIRQAFTALQSNIAMFRQTFGPSGPPPGFEERIPTFETFAALVRQLTQEGSLEPIIAALNRFGQALGIPGYAHGGEVSGPVGAPQLAVVHGGEQVLTRAQQGAASGANVQLTLNNYGVLGMDDAGQWLQREMASALRRGAFPQIARR